MTETKTPTVPIDPKMLSVLVCPKTRGPLIHDSETHELISKKAGLAYPIRDGVPILLIERARALNSALRLTARLHAPTSPS